MAADNSVLVIGAGIFGLTAALELQKRGHQVTVADPGPVPHPLATSNDLSRMVRADYGSDGLYSTLCADAIEGWRRWNTAWGRDLFPEDGMLLLTSAPMLAGEYEQDSYDMLTGRGFPVERLAPGDLARRFPRWNSEYYVDGYFSPTAGWAEAGEIIASLVKDVAEAGVSVVTGFKAARLLQDGDRVSGAAVSDGAELRADWVVVAAGVWTTVLLPELADRMWPVGQPVFYFRPEDPESYRPPLFPPWAADVPRSGWYGFPANDEGVVEMANHGPGRRVHPDAERVILAEEEVLCRSLLAQSLPSLATASLSDSKMCLYCDTWDGDFWIARDPERQGLVVAAGGSGHGFKFGPVLGGVIADALEGTENPYSVRFAWAALGEFQKDDMRDTGA